MLPTLDDSGGDRDRVPTGSGRTPEQRQLLSHMRGERLARIQAEGQARQPQANPQVQQALDPRQQAQAKLHARWNQTAKTELPGKESDAKQLLDEAEQLMLDKGQSAHRSAHVPQKLRDDYGQTKGAYTFAKANGNFVAATARLGEHKKAAVNLINGAKAAKLKQEQRAGQASSFNDLSETLGRVKKSSFPVGQAAYIESLPAMAASAGKGSKVTLNPLFMGYVTRLAALEEYKAAAAKSGAERNFEAQLKQRCMELVQAANGYLEYFQNLPAEQQQDSTRLSEKRYCEEGLLSARQYMVALEFERVSDPSKSPDGWSEEEQLRAASVRAKVLFHEASQQAATLGDGGDVAGASESRWIQGADWKAVKGAKPGSLRASESDDGAGLIMPAEKRTAIFKAGLGERAPDGMRDKKGAGAIKEALACANAKLFASQTGIDLGVPETNLVAVHRYALKGGGPDVDEKGNKLAATPDDEVVGSAQNNAGASKELADLSLEDRQGIEVKDVQRIALIDLMSLNCDRHSGNLMVKAGARGQPSLVPIDHGGSMPTRGDFSKAKARIASVDAGGDITNSLLKMPAAYEPFDPQTLSQLELLDPPAIEAGMKRQRDAMDAVHPGLKAKEKLPDSSLHLAKRALMFTKVAAKSMSPAEIQIALGQRGEDLFDVADAGFQALADQVIADFVPKKEAYKEVLTGPTEFRAELVQWLQDNGWVQFDPIRSFEASGAIFLMRNPEVALKLYRSGTRNPNPPPTPIEVSDKVAPFDAKNPPVVTDELKERFAVAFPTQPKDTSDKNWIERAHYLALFLKSGGPAVYQDILTRTGCEPDANSRAHVQAMQYWQRLKEPGNAALLLALKPNGGGVEVSDYLKDLLESGLNADQFATLMGSAEQIGATIVIPPNQPLAADLQRVRATATDPFAGTYSQALLAEAADIEGKVQRLELTPEDGREAALGLEARARRIVLDAIAAWGRAEAAQLMKQVDSRKHAIINTKVGDIASACLALQSVDAAHRAVAAFEADKKSLLHDEKVEQAERDLLPAFDWDAHAASTAKKAAIRQGFILDKDTGMSDALKLVSAAQKEFDAVLGSKVRPEKKRPVGDKAIAAYQQFAEFVERKLRPLTAAEPPARAWVSYCDGAVKAAATKMAFIKTLMSQWR